MPNRMLFAARSLPPPKPLFMGELEIGDVIWSNGGLRAFISSYAKDRYFVEILDGTPFALKHSEEIEYNSLIKRYQIYAQHLTKWHRAGERINQPSGNELQLDVDGFLGKRRDQID